MAFPFEVLQNTRKFFQKTIEITSLENLNKIPDGFNNNIIWNIGHIVVTEQLLANKLSGLPTVIDNTLIEKYRKGTKPETKINLEEVNEIKSLLSKTINYTLENYKKGLYNTFTEYTVSTTGNTLKNIDESLQFVLFHEGIHLGVVMALLKEIKK